jgi:hypothetical protein
MPASNRPLGRVIVLSVCQDAAAIERLAPKLPALQFLYWRDEAHKNLEVAFQSLRRQLDLERSNGDSSPSRSPTTYTNIEDLVCLVGMYSIYACSGHGDHLKAGAGRADVKPTSYTSSHRFASRTTKSPQTCS